MTANGNYAGVKLLLSYGIIKGFDLAIKNIEILSSRPYTTEDQLFQFEQILNLLNEYKNKLSSKCSEQCEKDEEGRILDTITSFLTKLESD